MAKLQQMNEMSKQNSQIILCNGYVTYEGKRYNECVPFEREAFNEALHVVRGGKKRNSTSVKLFTTTKENYTPSGKVSKAMFDCLISKAYADEDSTTDYFAITATHGIYHLWVAGEWVRDENANRSTIAITYNDSYVMYKSEFYELQFTNEQKSKLLDLLSKVYERLEKEYEDARLADYYETESSMAYAHNMNNLTDDWYSLTL